MNKRVVGAGVEAAALLARVAVAKVAVTRATHATFCISIGDVGGP